MRCSYRRSVALVVVSVLASSLAKAQSGETAATVTTATQTDVLDARERQARTFESMVYGTFRPNIIGAGRGVFSTLPVLLFDAQVAARYALRSWAKGRGDGWLRRQLLGPSMQLVGNVDLDIRMRDSTSKPVRMPSYRPGVFLYRQLGGDGNYIGRLGFSHYSNGQSEPQIRANGLTNIRDGEFTSNYVDVALVRSLDTKFRRDAVIFEAQRYFDQDDVSKVGLGQLRVGAVYQAQWGSEKNTRLLLRADAHFWPQSQKFPGVRSTTVDVTFGVDPKWLDDAGFFARAYAGVDAYNLWYDRGLQHYLQIGLMAWPFRPTK